MRQSFHGRTYAALTATGQPKYHDGFEPLVPGFRYADFNELASVESQLGDQTAAVIVEPIQGEGGVLPARVDFLKGLREMCNQTGALLIFDEVQTGMGRTGTLFAYEQLGVKPDILTTAKGLGGGLPIGGDVVAPKRLHTDSREEVTRRPSAAIRLSRLPGWLYSRSSMRRTCSSEPNRRERGCVPGWQLYRKDMGGWERFAAWD